MNMTHTKPSPVCVCVSDSCPVLCSGNGEYDKGVCVCHAGWKGAECEVEDGQCIDPTCSNNGECINGVCVCAPAFKGNNCEEGVWATHTHSVSSFIPQHAHFLTVLQRVN